MEEMMTNYGQSGTFDDYVHGRAAELLLRIYLIKRDEQFRGPLQKAIDMVLESQYPAGGWPERWPLDPKGGYTVHLTLNDDVSLTNILFLIKCLQTHVIEDTPELRNAIARGMNVMIILQNGQPAAGWSRQYDAVTLKPSPARSYEPIAINTSHTIEMIGVMQNFYHLTGETKFLNGIPAAIDFLESIALSDEDIARAGRNRSGTNIVFPRNIDPVTGIPMYTHRRGSNIATGFYFHNDELAGTIGHMSSFGSANIARLREQYEAAKAVTLEEIYNTSPLFAKEFVPLPRFYSRAGGGRFGGTQTTIRELITSLNSDGLWLTPLPSTSNVFKPIPANSLNQKNSNDTRFVSTNVGDEYDTSTFSDPTSPTMGITSAVFISNMARLIEYLEGLK